ncbi:MAG TPA: YidB family protein [Povalibacter sp.]|nr:YidB family protein [Povalibacter sp.]
MGLLDQIVGAALGGGMPGASAQSGAPQGGSNISAILLQQVVAYLSRPGALSSLTSASQQMGIGNVVQSWVSTGQNLPISPSQLQQMLGAGTVADIAQKAGIGVPEAAAALSGLLPHVIDKATPSGAAPASHDEFGSLLASVGKFLN